jgi:hypothetical protein
MRTATRALAVAGAATLALATGIAGMAIGVGLGPTPIASRAADPAPAALSTPELEDPSQAELALLAPELERDGGAGPGALRQRLIRVGGRNLVHAVVTVDRKGTLVTFQVDRGTVAAVGSGSLSIAQAGGGSAAIATIDATRVRKAGKKAAPADLAKGDTVVVLGRVENGRATATFILVPVEKPAKPSGGSGPASSPAPQPQG